MLTEAGVGGATVGVGLCKLRVEANGLIDYCLDRASWGIASLLAKAFTTIGIILSLLLRDKTGLADNKVTVSVKNRIFLVVYVFNG